MIACVSTLFSCSTQKYYNQWVMVDTDNYFYDETGRKLKNIERKIDGNTYFFDRTGKMVTGFQNIDNKRKYFDNNGKLLFGWQRINNNQYYFDKSNGEMKTGWFEEFNSWYYFDNDGILKKNSWVENKYYVDGNGKMLSNGYYNVDGKKLYFTANGQVDYNHKELTRKKLPIYEKTVYGKKEYNHDYSDTWPINFYIEYDKDDIVEKNFDNEWVYIYSDRKYVEMSQVNIVCELGVIRQKLKYEVLLEALLYRENGQLYDKAYIYILSTDGMQYKLWSDPINIDLRETDVLTIKLREYKQ